ncbi:MAG TPA: RiPP maturation radical SAM C-methyltransferase [Pyrinomonadaceae bacterium]|nr:RiPP maturation radical SAM C-methyltransferase [Pyrinomonadaceae bacterium]
MDIVFVVMPFADLGRPAIGVSLLKSAALREGYSALIEYCNIQLGDELGAELYQQISSALPPNIVTGEWFFADDLFGGEIPDTEQYVNGVLSQQASDELVEQIVAGRSLVSKYLDDCARRIAAHSPRMVGFTTTFHQTCASLAVAKRLKALPEPPLIVFGGANCEGEMGLQLLQSFPWIDYVCCGESDISFPKLLDSVFRGGPTEVPGVLQRDQANVIVKSEGVQDMNMLPYPDYDDYFAQLEGSKVGRKTAYNVIVETSRGCWWGAKHHCTFCGLNGDTMAFRSKTPERAYDEITALAGKYDMQKVGFVDNILDMRYIDTLFPRLAENGMQLELFYEVKSNLRYDQVVKLHRGGMRQIQPGIENFSNQVLRLMEKGVSGLQNIQLMRWCEEVGIECSWNVLGGFPEESPTEYERIARMASLLFHLQPPISCGQIRLDRFSPFHTRSEHFGFRRLRPSRGYFYVFPLGRREMMRLAYFFDFDYGDGRDPDGYMKPIRDVVRHWWAARTAAAPAKLDAWFDLDSVRISDSRDSAALYERELNGLAAWLLLYCDAATTVDTLARRSDLEASPTEIESTLKQLSHDRLMLEDEGQFLSLPVFRSRPPVNDQRLSDAYITAKPSTADTLLRVV